ncbi:spore germination protein [Desmospora activa]|uniref:Spore germination protein KA n=1 Tax=Desmospora activa DSM 45169 TaxID=1121389 RepID=A0A2T4Z894_9BACL|nr:spore germination protein [Desmospora activa]PTM58108.1 spore germination protein KA [Desmospora activa DSM 45169]
MSLRNRLRKRTDSKQKDSLLPDLQINVQKVKEMLGDSSDLNLREIKVGRDGLTLGVMYIEGLVDTKVVNNNLLEPLQSLSTSSADIEGLVKGDPDRLIDASIYVVGVDKVRDFPSLSQALLSGDTVILIDGEEQGYAVDTRGGGERGVTEPSSQSVVRGPREGFSENLRTNTALIRRRVRDTHLRLETRSIGRVTKTEIGIMYIQGIVNDKIVEEVRRRLDRIDIDSILESGYIEELIQDETFTPFPTVYNTERPDIVAGSLLEGRVAILVNGTPFVLLVPSLFVEFFQSVEDYYQRADIATLLRLLRFLAMSINLLLPSLYIAITTFHQELLPTTLLYTLAAQREGVPFPAFVEALLMESLFEILREAGIRMPRAIGQAVSIVGTVVIGLTGVQAGLASAAMTIVVSVTAISSFIAPAYNIAISVRILRYLFMAAAASFGLYGITIGLIALVLHLCSLRSFGVPYMSPFAPFDWSDQKDSFFRVPLWNMITRPRLLAPKNRRRENTPPPSPQAEGGE